VHLRQIALTTVVGTAVVLASCSSPRSSGEPHGASTSSTTSIPSSSTTTGAPGSSSTTSTSAAPAAAAIEVQIYSTGVLFTIEAHVSNLSSRISNPHFASPTEFDFAISGVTIPSSDAGTTTSATGAVSTVELSASQAVTAVRILLRSAETSDQISVGAGSAIQVTFS